MTLTSSRSRILDKRASDVVKPSDGFSVYTPHVGG